MTRNLQYRLTGGAAVACIALGALVLVGWSFDVEALKSALPGLVTMKANAALGFILCGVALWPLRFPEPDTGPGRLRVAQAAAAMALLLGLVTLSQYVFSLDAGIDQLLFREGPAAVATSHPGRMAPNTALSFFASGTALLLLLRGAPRRRLGGSLLMVEGAAAIVCLAALTSLVGYATEVEIGHRWGTLTGAAVHTAAGFAVLGVGIFAAAWRLDQVHWLIGTWATTALVGGVTIMAALVGAAYVAVRDMEHTSQRVSETNEERLLTAELHWAIHELATAAMGYALTGQEFRLARHDSAVAAVAAAMDELRGLADDEPDLESSFDALRPLVAGRLDVATEIIETRRLRGEEAAATMIRAGRGRALMDGIHERLDALDERATSRAATVQAASARATQRTFLMLPLAGLVGLVVLLLAVLTLNREIGARWAAADAARRSEEQFRVAFEETAIGFALVAPDGRFIRVNDTLCNITGYAREELERMTFQQITHPDDLAEDVGYVEEVLAGERRTYSMEKRYLRKDGSVVWVSLTVSLVRGEGDEPSYFISAIKDISERKRMENEIRRAQKLDTIGQLAGGIAHDFNNLLTIINGTAEMVEMGLEEDDPVREELDTILSAGSRAAELTAKILAFSRQQVLKPVAIDLSTLLTRFEPMLRRLIPENIAVELRRAEDLWTVRADPTHVEQVLLNLAVNSRDAMPNGGSLVMETANVVLDEAHGRMHPGAVPGPHVMLAVSDTGSGMDEATQLRVFEPFFTTKAPGEGTGLGLATVYGIVKQSGGSIYLYSEVGRGTVFKIYLPRLGGGPSPIEPQAAAGALRGTETVLVVEDDPVIRQMVVRVLKRHGYTVLEAGSGTAGLEMAKRHPGPIDLLMTDLVMPGMGGAELATHLKRLNPRLRVLFASGYAVDVARLRARDEKAGFIGKPYGLIDLTRKVREALDV